MKVRKHQFLIVAAVMAAVIIAASFSPAPTTQAQASPNCIGGTPSGAFCSYTPAQLGVSTLTAPMAGTTALSTIIDTRGATSATLMAACTVGNDTINVQTYAEDGTTTGALIVPVTAIAAAAKVQLFIGSQANPSVNTGTLSATAILRFPQRALAFSFDNAGAAGSCTARLFLAYN